MPIIEATLIRNRSGENDTATQRCSDAAAKAKQRLKRRSAAAAKATKQRCSGENSRPPAAGIRTCGPLESAIRMPKIRNPDPPLVSKFQRHTNHPYFLSLIPYSFFIIPYILFLIPYCLFIIPYSFSLISYSLLLIPQRCTDAQAKAMQRRKRCSDAAAKAQQCRSG